MNLQDNPISSTMFFFFKSSMRSGDSMITSVDPATSPMVTGIVACDIAL